MSSIPLILVAICSSGVGFGAQVRGPGPALPAPRGGGGEADCTLRPPSIAEQRAYIEEKEQEQAAWRDHHHAHDGKSFSLCRTNELSGADLAMKEASSRPAAAWRALFQAWNGKKVLLGGDSLMDQLFQVASCAVVMMGGSANVSNRVKMEWARDNQSEKTVDIAGKPWAPSNSASKRNRYTQLMVFQVSAHVGDYSFTMDYLRHYSLTNSCHQCNKDEFFIWEGTGSCSGVCSNQAAFIAKIESMAMWVKQQAYDHIFMNVGHDVLYKNYARRVEGKAQELVRAFGKHFLTGSLVFVEHPPQHFNSLDGTGDYSAGCDMTCNCKLANLSGQAIAINNRRLRQVAQSRGIKLARIWSHFESFCDKHRSRDCTHYHISPEMWVPIAEEIGRLS